MRKGLNARGRISWQMVENDDCKYLIRKGMAMAAIRRVTGLTDGQIVYRMKVLGFNLTQYRNGESEEGQRVLGHCKVFQV